jgi:hypothetical protein
VDAQHGHVKSVQRAQSWITHTESVHGSRVSPGLVTRPRARLTKSWNRRSPRGYGQSFIDGYDPVRVANGLEIQRETKTGFYMRGWPGPIPHGARLSLPPVPRHAVWGPAARAESRRLLAWNERFPAKRPLRPYQKQALQAVARGEAPLKWSTWHDALTRLELAETGRRAAKDRTARPFRLELGSGGISHR